jgi:hexosaminidase
MLFLCINALVFYTMLNKLINLQIMNIPQPANPSRVNFIKYFILLALVLSFTLTDAQIHIIPQPVSVTTLKGSFTLKASTIITVDAQSEAVGNYLHQYLLTTYNLNLKVEFGTSKKNDIELFSGSVDNVVGAYILKASPKKILISANGAGCFYGVQSLIQLITITKGRSLQVPACEIEDHPRFKWRGLSLDVSRHFFTVNEVERYIDMMAHYKLNIFHWHLTDDEGWRIQIDKYPLLTQVGSKMSYYSKNGQFRKFDNVLGDGSDGFYTKDDIRSVIKYAQDRFITILPEIEMPGHSEAAIFAYPQLATKDSTGVIHQRRGILEPSEYTFTFYENVLAEVMHLFPDQYIHIGGDEANVSEWLKDPTAVALMKSEHFTDPSQVQSYFIKRIETFINSKGKKLIGWDEILKGGLASSATVMSWEGEQGGITAAKMHHDVIMTPLPQMYFDAPQANAADEPIGWNPPVTWQMVYNYEPQSKELTPEEAKYILGAQANIWSEKIATMDHLEYMVYPRVLAVAELTWTPREDKNIDRFEQSMYANYRLFKLWNLNARIPSALGLEDIITNKDDVEIMLSHPLSDTKATYKLNQQFPFADTSAKHYPIIIKHVLTDTLGISVYTNWTINQQRILQTATIKHVKIQPAKTDVAELMPGLAYMVYKTAYNNYPAVDTGENFISGILHQNDIIKPFAGPFNTWVKLNGYIKINTENDYRITTGFETSPLLLLDNVVIINRGKNKYAEPQAAVLHLKKGIYLLIGYYLADEQNSGQILINVKMSDGKQLEYADYLFH